MKGPRVWVVSELYYPEETSTGYLMAQIAEGIAQRFDVYVLCGQPTYAARGQRAPVKEVRNGVRIIRCAGTTFHKDNLALRFLNAASITVTIFINALLRLRRGDEVLVVTNPPFLPFVVSVASRLRGASCSLIVHDVYPENMVAIGMAQPNTRLIGLLDRLNAWMYGTMTRVIVLSRDMRDLVAHKVCGRMEKIVVIPNWADLALVSPTSRSENPLLRELNLQGRFVVQYAGNMGRTHGLETILEAARNLSGEDVHFLFIGWGAKKRWLEETAITMKMTNVTILENKPRSEQPIFLNACDVSVISFIPGMAGVSVPSRMYNVLAAGKPIIAVADDHSELARVVREEQVGWVVPPGRADTLAEAVREAKSNRARLLELSVRARQAVEARYSLKQAIDSYCAILDPERQRSL